MRTWLVEEVGMNMPSDAAPEATAQTEQPARSAAAEQTKESAQAKQAEQGDEAVRGHQDAAPAAPAPVQPAPAAPILPAQSREDTDVGWGDYAERDDNDRLLRDRPPHWDNA
jgi:hypothetical protein